MPVSTITTAFVKQYEANLYVLSQQMGSKFQPCVTVKSVTSAEEAYWDTIGTVAAQKKTVRHGDTPNNEQDHGRRKAVMEDYNTNSFVDREDELKMLIQPTSKYALTQVAALGRAKDDAIIEAALGTALIGKTGSSSIAFKDDSVSIGGDANGAGKTTLGTLAAVGTVADIDLLKILTMSQIFNEADVDADLARYWAVSPKDIKDMLDLTEVGSADYNTVRTLVQGKVDTFNGFKFFWTNRLTKDAATSTAYRTIAWAEGGIILGLGKEIKSRIDERSDKCYAVQVYSEMSIGAVRMEGAKVHECLNKVAE